MISLSDLLTPMEVIEKRLRAAAEADFIICLYNPSSRKRHDYLERACRILLEYKSGETACGYVQNIGREGEAVHLLTLAELEKTPVDAASMPAHMRALRRVGVPYTDAQIDGAPAELAGKTEMDATIAYLQSLGLALK